MEITCYLPISRFDHAFILHTLKSSFITAAATIAAFILGFLTPFTKSSMRWATHHSCNPAI